MNFFSQIKDFFINKNRSKVENNSMDISNKNNNHDNEVTENTNDDDSGKYGIQILPRSEDGIIEFKIINGDDGVVSFEHYIESIKFSIPYCLRVYNPRSAELANLKSKIYEFKVRDVLDTLNEKFPNYYIIQNTYGHIILDVPETLNRLDSDEKLVIDVDAVHTTIANILNEQSNRAIKYIREVEKEYSSRFEIKSNKE